MGEGRRVRGGRPKRTNDKAREGRAPARTLTPSMVRVTSAERAGEEAKALRRGAAVRERRSIAEGEVAAALERRREEG